MEVDLTTSDDPPECHDQNPDDDSLLDHALPLELTHEAPETTSCNEHCDQDETPPEESGADNGKASGKSPCKMQQGAIFSGKILSFCCSECKDDTTYSPNDLLKHFQGAHKGTLPTYPCDLCSFVTNEFSALQRHRIGHRNTLVTCEICNDGVQYSLLLLTRHFTTCHSRNGHFRCKKCEFSTRDAGTFVQHIHRHNERNHKCVKCPQGEHQRHSLVHTGTFPFTCQICGYGAARREYLNKHLTVAHPEEMDRTNKWRANEDNSGVNSPGLKLLLKKSPPVGGSREPQWMSKLNSLPGVGLLDHNGRLFNPEKTLEETQQFLERAVGVKKESNKWTKSPVKTEQSLHPIPSTTPQPKSQENELSPGSGLLNPTNSNGLTVLMVKNKISIPPNCTTKVMGFKMVDGKKHLVLKVIPTKQEPSTENEVSDSHIDEDEDRTASSPSSSSSPSVGSLLSLDSGVSNLTGVRKDLKSLLKEESQDIENHIGNQSPLIEMNELSMEKTSRVVEQVYDEDTENTDKMEVSSSVLHDVDMLTSKDSELSLCPSSQSNGRSPSNDNDESFPCSSERISKEDNESADPPVKRPVSASELSSAVSETAPADLPMGEMELTKEDIALDSVTDEPSLSQLSADETTCPEAISLAKADPEMTVEDKAAGTNVLQSKPLSKTITDGTAFSVDSKESLSQKPQSANNENLSNDFSEHCNPCENNSEQSSPIKIQVEINTVHDSVTGDGEDADTDRPGSSVSAIKTLPSNIMDGDSSQFCPNVSLASSSSETPALESVLNCKSSEVTKNEYVPNSSPQKTTSAGKSTDAKDCSVDVENNSLNSPSQEVFSFHNYSKDTSGSSPDSLLPEEHSPQGLEEEECEEDFGDWSLTLPPSPPLPNEQSEEDTEDSKQRGANSSDLVSESGEKTLERVSDSDIEVDECIATVDDSLVPVLPESESERETAGSSKSEKKQEDISPDRAATGLNSAAVLGKILEKHSDAIISQQLEKERMQSSSSTVQEAIRPTKTTLRILQTPEGKQQMFLQTTETPYAVPVQLKSGAGFKLITKSCSPKINVSYVKPGIETHSKATGVALTLNGGRIGMSAQGSSGETKSQTSVQMAQSSSGNRYFLNATALKGPLLLSGAVKSSSGEQTNNMPQTCYLVQRPLPVSPVSGESAGASTKTVLATRPVLAMPVNTGDKSSSLQTGRQAYLVRYISPAKSGILLNNSDGKALNQGNQANEGGKNRVFLKIVRSPNGTKFLSPCTSDKKSIYLATSSLQSPCLLMSSNKSFTNLSSGLKTSANSQSPSHKSIPAQIKHILPHSDVQIKSRGDHNVALHKSQLIPIPIRPRSQRKRRRKALFEEWESSPKIRKVTSKSTAEKDATSIWEPVAKDVERTLRLSPFSPLQEIKCPRRNQPVVVLNHPDADIPEVASIMRSVNKYKGEVLKVSLSKTTVKALSELSLADPSLSKQNASNSNGVARPRPVGRTAQERFILKLKLKKTSRNKYEVVRSSSAGSEQQTTFCCWFCGRVFNNQEEWIGHGQRHLMEATRDWNKLF